MEKQIDVSVQSAAGAEAYRWVHWLICDNGMTFGEGTAVFDSKTGRCAWKEERPPAEYEEQARRAIARAERMDGITDGGKKRSPMKTPLVLSFTLYSGMALALAGCGGGGSAPTTAAVSQITGTNSESGIHGMAVEGPILPMQQAGQTNTRPLVGAILTVQPAGGGAEVTRATSDTQGNFQFVLPPGTYRLVPLPPTPGLPYPTGPPQTVIITASVFLTLTVNYDTGIR